MSNKTVAVNLTYNQIDLLRGVLFEYYTQNAPYDSAEESVRLELEDILADAENEVVA